VFDYGSLYGTAQAGGTSNHGVIFRVGMKSGDEEVIYNFSGGADGATPYSGLSFVRRERASGLVYGVVSEGGSKDMGTIFSFNLLTHGLTTLYSFVGGKHGYLPYSSLRYAAGTFYGSTSGGGTTMQGGTLFAFKP
jgi:uncharacterized repeat protein (TIGR03803 family)